VAAARKQHALVDIMKALRKSIASQPEVGGSWFLNAIRQSRI
jgi:hypothetical protein